MSLQHFFCLSDLDLPVKVKMYVPRSH